LSRRSQTQADHGLVAPKSDVGGSCFTFRDHHIHDYLYLAAALGARDEPIAPNLVVTAEEVESVAGKFELPQSSAARPIFGLNPGAEYGPAKRWPADRFVAAAREIQKQTNCTWLIFGGKGDVPVASEIYSALLAAPESDEGGSQTKAGSTFNVQSSFFLPSDSPLTRVPLPASIIPWLRYLQS
jgi:heptosyltransferase-2